ncbi:hypothetical protein F5050DRAFT_1786701 [Lentinula boryana]|uniref:Uncharacterized protein n=1 Tax=Lentinula boryana TaxID=40481 RepID=A0ABQ8Q4U6_9AGAR|nr:hypothetical protein F5050DRAFT_1786701 [Lentinula boryana]
MNNSSLHFAVPTTVPTILASVILLPLSLLVSRGIYHLYFSPLSLIPGPWYAAVSDLWIIVHTLRCRKVRATMVVRVVPGVRKF